ncbi:LANO_0B08196g1_1 [Lachancea nothofagi CBS 11611]|uniref:LANO_0B08196g1_1 n=1 Tax=Lachancea nothofagi CBS 11611 TaxID=1266666 RepID=A0A1G4J0M3_9SACH|nr:LANO_0B08196g1_1 [Lachancea nothofagi CBS 11611]
MVFKSFKCKFYSKGYHSSAQKQTTAFFESSYQYLRRNQGVVSQDGCIQSSHSLVVGPNPVVVANVNYNNVELVLDTEASEDHQMVQSRLDSDLPREEHWRATGSRRASFGAVTTSAAAPGAQSLDHFRSRQHKDSFPHYPNHRHLEINQRLSRSYFSTSAVESSGNHVQDGLPLVPMTVTEVTASPEKLDYADGVAILMVDKHTTQAEPATKETSPTVKDTTSSSHNSPWEVDHEESLNPQTFLNTQITQIRNCFARGDYNSINAHYQALHRNDIVPPVEIYALIIESVCRRNLDNDNVDNRMFQLLNCYQALINNKMKPTEQIYNAVIGSLFKGSILAHEAGNGNGIDFYKIAVDLFRASNAHKSHEFSKELLDCSLLAMNLYPGYVEFDYVKNVLHNSKLYFKDSFYYVALSTYAKNINNNAALKSVYEEFRTASVSDTNLQIHQYEVYSSVLSGLVETGDMALAIKLLDKVLTDAKEKVGLASNVSLVLTNFLLSVSKMDCQKAYELWYEFKKLYWVPEFSYDFYLSFLSNALGNWSLSKKLYDYMFPMKRSLKEKSASLNEHLLRPVGTESILSSFLDYALQLKDTEVVMKLLEESVVKNVGFEAGVYPYVFQFLKSIHCPDDYLLRFINCHGQLCAHSKDRFEFLNGLIDAYQSQVVLSRTAETKFFMDCCRTFNVSESRSINYSGLIACFQSLWASPQTIEKYSYNLELHGTMICKLHDLDGYYAVMENEFLLQFKDQLTARFEKLMINYKRLSLNPNSISGTSVQAARMISMPEELIEYFSHPGEWDKTYPLCLGSMLRNSFSTGYKTYERLRNEGFCFDYDTYKQLITQRVNDLETVTKSLELCPDEEERRYLANCLVVKTSSKNLEEKIMKHPFFKSKVLPYLKEASFIRLAKNVSDIQVLIEHVDFPYRFKGIAEQAEHKETIRYVYGELFRMQRYSEIVDLNSECPVLNVTLLLKSCIRSGNVAKYKLLFNKFKSSIGKEALNIQAEYLISNKKIEEAIKLLKASHHGTEHKTNDLLSFALFLRSCKERVIQLDKVENTLQLANVLSAQETFSSTVALYQTLMQDVHANRGSNVKQAVSREISEQMLNNLNDSLQFVDIENEQVKKIMLLKVVNYFRFRMFLKLPELMESDVTKLVNIYSKVNPSAIDSLFNNIVETIYLNSKTRALYLQNDMTFRFKPEQLARLVHSIKEFYEFENNQEDADKTKSFITVLKKLYKF